MPNLQESLDNLRHRLTQIDAARYQQITPLENWFIIDHLDGLASAPQPDDPRWQPITIGQSWGGTGEYAWFKTQIPPFEQARPNMSPVLLLRLFDYTRKPADPLGLYGQMRPEALVYADGIPVQATNRGHFEVVLSGATGGVMTVAAACGYSTETRYFHQANLAQLDTGIDALYWDASVVYGLANGTLPDRETGQMIEALTAALLHIDWRNFPHLGGVAEARAALRAAAFTEHPDTAPLIHAIGHAHIDLAWLWPLAFSRAKGIRTATSQLDLMNRYPAYTFMQSQPQLYRAIAEDAPDVFAEIQERIREGRWNATGATWVEPDTNLISGESLVRQFLHGMRYFQQTLGVRPRVLWLPDTFGFNAQIPQIMQSSGVPYFYTSKMSWNTTNRIPNDTFRWRGLDGTEVVAHMATTRRQGQTATCYDGNLTPYEAADTWQSYRNKSLNRHTMVAYGYGDGGGGPDRDTVERLQRYQDGVLNMAALKASTAEAFFEALEADLQGELPVWSGELYFELHRGVYTTQARTKRYNRLLEARLHDAEFIQTWAHLHAGSAYPRAEIRKIWDVLLTNQFHDILPGSSIRETYIQAEAEYAAALDQAHHLIEDGLAALRGSTADAGWLVVNTLSHARAAVVEIAVNPAEIHGLADSSGSPVRWQAVDDGHVLVELPSLPAFGSGEIIKTQQTITVPASDLSVSPGHLENAALRVEFDSVGRITRIWDKASQREVVSSGSIANEFQMFQDNPARWQAWDIDPDYVDMRLPDPVPSGIEVVESGPVRAAVVVEYRFGASSIRQKISLTSNSAVLSFDTDVDWHERHTLLKAAFPLDVTAARATYEIPFGAVERPLHRNTSWDTARFEVPALRWADISEAGFGVALLNDCKHGHDAQDNVLRLSLLRAPTMPDPEADQGLHHIRYALVPHQGDWRHSIVTDAAAFNHPPLVTSLADDAAVPAAIASISGTAIIDTVKLAEDSDSVVIRVYEPHGARQQVTVTTAGGFSGADEINVLEEPIEGAGYTVDGQQLTFTLKPFQVRSFRLLHG